MQLAVQLQAKSELEIAGQQMGVRRSCARCEAVGKNQKSQVWAEGWVRAWHSAARGFLFCHLATSALSCAVPRGAGLPSCHVPVSAAIACSTRLRSDPLRCGLLRPLLLAAPPPQAIIARLTRVSARHVEGPSSADIAAAKRSRSGRGGSTTKGGANTTLSFGVGFGNEFTVNSAKYRLLKACREIRPRDRWRCTQSSGQASS